MSFNTVQSLNIYYSILYILIVSSFGVYGIILAGWSSNSKYSFIGMHRAISQALSYEIVISLCLVLVILFSQSLCLDQIIYIQGQTVWFLFPLLPVAIIFFVSILAETNRTPFDLTESEAELVSGYNTEYSSFFFACFFLGEYSSIIFMSELFICLFCAGGHLPIISYIFSETFSYNIFLSLKTVFIMFLFVFIRANFPRYRFKDLMLLC